MFGAPTTTGTVPTEKEIDIKNMHYKVGSSDISIVKNLRNQKEMHFAC